MHMVEVSGSPGEKSHTVYALLPHQSQAALKHGVNLIHLCFSRA